MNTRKRLRRKLPTLSFRRLPRVGTQCTPIASSTCGLRRHSERSGSGEGVLELRLRHPGTAFDRPPAGFGVKFAPRLAVRFVRFRCCRLFSRAVNRRESEPPVAGVLSRLLEAPICDFPSRSCCPVLPAAFFRSVFRRFRAFRLLLPYFDATACSRAIAIACLRLLTGPPFPPGRFSIRHEQIRA